jgi:hypothetical protein
MRKHGFPFLAFFYYLKEVVEPSYTEEPPGCRLTRSANNPPLHQATKEKDDISNKEEQEEEENEDEEDEKGWKEEGGDTMSSPPATEDMMSSPLQSSYGGSQTDESRKPEKISNCLIIEFLQIPTSYIPHKQRPSSRTLCLIHFASGCLVARMCSLPAMQV